MMRIICCFCLILILLVSGPGKAMAGPLSERVAAFPHWTNKPPAKPAEGDLIYPDWMAGTWNAASTLVEMLAPLAPAIITPGFESNRPYIDKPVSFTVRFTPNKIKTQPPSISFLPITASPLTLKRPVIVADRTFNGLNIAMAYLGKEAVIGVKTDPKSPNRQITLLRGDRQLVSTVTGRLSETLPEGDFLATEISQQLFESKTRIYLNEVETTTAYKKPQLPSKKIHACQITAIYLSPQDPKYFEARNNPVALYRYDLELVPLSN